MTRKKREILFDIPSEDAPGYLKRQIDKNKLISRIVRPVDDEGNAQNPLSFEDAVKEVVEYLKQFLKKEEDAETLEKWFIEDATQEDIEYVLGAFEIFLFGVQPKPEKEQGEA